MTYIFIGTTASTVMGAVHKLFHTRGFLHYFKINLFACLENQVVKRKRHLYKVGVK